MDNNYQKFGKEWRKQMMRLTKKQLRTLMRPSFANANATKALLIDILRCQFIVNQFNEKHKVGDTLLWLPTTKSRPVLVTVKEKAFVNNLRPLVFFEERSGFCSIESCFLLRLECDSVFGKHEVTGKKELQHFVDNIDEAIEQIEAFGIYTCLSCKKGELDEYRDIALDKKQWEAYRVGADIKNDLRSQNEELRSHYKTL